MMRPGAAISAVRSVIAPASATPGTRATISRTSPGMRLASAKGPRVPLSTTQSSAPRLRVSASASATTPW
jgi:hypothetical protein